MGAQCGLCATLPCWRELPGCSAGAAPAWLVSHQTMWRQHVRHGLKNTGSPAALWRPAAGSAGWRPSRSAGSCPAASSPGRPGPAGHRLPNRRANRWRRLDPGRSRRRCGVGEAACAGPIVRVEGRCAGCLSEVRAFGFMGSHGVGGPIRPRKCSEEIRQVGFAATRLWRDGQIDIVRLARWLHAQSVSVAARSCYGRAHVR